MAFFRNIILLTIFIEVYTRRVHLHLQPELIIADYTGALHKDVLELMKHAEVLEFHNCNITGIRGHAFSKLHKLRKLAFINTTANHNGLELENMFSGADRLKEFYAINIDIQELSPHSLRKAPLEIFVMTDHDHYKKLPENTFNETKLKRLDLSRNGLEVIENGAFNGLDKLETLELKTNKIKDLSKDALVPLKSIKTINLRENLIDKFDFENVPELAHLEMLDLGYNPLVELKMENVEKIAPNLKKIDVTQTKLSKDDIEGLKTKYPNITFET